MTKAVRNALHPCGDTAFAGFCGLQAGDGDQVGIGGFLVKAKPQDCTGIGKPSQALLEGERALLQPNTALASALVADLRARAVVLTADKAFFIATL